MKPGVYSDISNDDYHHGPGISKSGLDLIRRSPLHYKAAIDSTNDNQPTTAQAIGSALHMLVLEPAEFVKHYCLALRRSDAPDAIDDRDHLVAMVQKLNETRLPKLPTGGSKADQVARIVEAEADLPEGIRAAPEKLEAMKAADLKLLLETMNESRPGLLPISGSRHDLAEILRANGVEVTLWSDVLAQWMQNNGERTVLSEEQWTQLHAMRDAVMAHPAAGALLKGCPGKAEQSVYWIDPETGVLCRCRPDWWRDDDLLVDLKTTEDASPEGFAKSIANWRYDVQDAYYQDGVKLATGRTPRGFVFIAVEKKPPYAVAVYRLDDESRDLGRAQYRADLNRYAECMTSGNWPGYSGRIEPISVPAWHANKNQRLLDGAA